MKRLLTTTAVAFVVGATALSPSFAHMTGDVPATMGMMGGDCPVMGMMGGPGMMNQGMMGQGAGGQGTMGQGMTQEHVHMDAVADGRLAFLKAELSITDAQMDVWAGYADVVKGRVATMQSMRQGMMEAMQTGDMTQRMDARISGMEAMVDSMKAIKPATEELYAALSDEQKQRADQLIGMGCGGM